MTRTVFRHTKDWCHVCGKRQPDLADIWYPFKAEGDRQGEKVNGPDQYVRICSECADEIGGIARGNLDPIGAK